MTIASCSSVNRSVANCLNIIFGIPRRCPLSPLTSSISESLRAVCSLDAMPCDRVDPPSNVASCVERSASLHAIQPEPWQARMDGKTAATVRLVRVTPEIWSPETCQTNRTDATHRTYLSHPFCLSCAGLVVDRPTARCQPIANLWPSSPKAAL